MEQGVRSFSEMPFWVTLDEDAGFCQMSNERVVAAGHRFRSIEESARDAWSWYRSHFFKDIVLPAAPS